MRAFRLGFLASVFLVTAVLVRAAGDSPTATLVRVPAGNYTPVLRTRDQPEVVPVAAFLLEERPVTNAEFLQFVRANPQWQRSRVSPLFADSGYLAHWKSDLEPGAGAPSASPVVRVSWFAARAYARWRGLRLPTTAEWERAAAAGFAGEAGSTEPAHRQAVLGWFSAPSRDPLPAVGMDRPNFLGIRDLNTLVWEWVSDFNTALTTGESRADTGLERDLYCAAGSVGARDTGNYPAFMRAGFRSSLRANYTVPNLGFRCASTTTP